LDLLHHSPSVSNFLLTRLLASLQVKYRRVQTNLQFIPDSKHIVFRPILPRCSGFASALLGSKAPALLTTAYGRTPHRNRSGSTPAQAQRQRGTAAARQSGRAHRGLGRRRKGHPRRDALSATHEREHHVEGTYCTGFADRFWSRSRLDAFVRPPIGRGHQGLDFVHLPAGEEAPAEHQPALPRASA
jgi:hypothetical protein